MANVLNIDVDWCGQQANEVLVRPTFNTDQLNSMFRVIMDIKSRRQMALDNTLEDVLRASVGCGRTGIGAINLTQKYLEVCDVAINLDQCAKNLRDTFMEDWLKTNTDITDLTGTQVQTYIEGKAVNAARIDVHKVAWFGDTDSDDDTLSSCDGFWKRFYEGVATYDIERIVISAPLADCESLDILRAMYDAQSDILYSQPDNEKYFMVTREIYQNYLACREDACCGDRSWEMIEEKKRVLMFRGIEVRENREWSRIIAVKGLGNTHRAILTLRENLWLGTDAMGEEAQMEWFYDKTTKLNHLDAEFKMGTNYYLGDLIVVAY